VSSVKALSLNDLPSVAAVWFEWIYNASTFLPQFCMHQIIETFENPDRKEDMTYAYLMVFGLFFGNFAGSQSTLCFEWLIVID